MPPDAAGVEIIERLVRIEERQIAQNARLRVVESAMKWCMAIIISAVMVAGLDQLLGRFPS